jgi:threonine dehydratase
MDQANQFVSNLSVDREEIKEASIVPAEFFAAARLIHEYMPETPLVSMPGLSGRFSLQLHGKCENLTPIRSFKLRGALYRLSLLDKQTRVTGVATCSTGNNGIGFAWAAQALGTSALVVMPKSASNLKFSAAQRYGADVRRAGNDLNASEAIARELALEEGRVFIEDGNDQGLMIGAGTIGLEILLQLPAVDVLLVPVGGGSLIAGIASCAKAIKPSITIIGVQSEEASSVRESFRAGRVIYAPCNTFAGGLATDHPGELALSVIERSVDDILLVSELELRRAVVTALAEVGQVLEGAGAAAIAVLDRYGSRWGGATVVAVLTGGNADRAELAACMALSEAQSSAASHAGSRTL